jgi:hypothetical protein
MLDYQLTVRTPIDAVYNDKVFAAYRTPCSVHLYSTACGHISIGQEDDHAEMATCNSGGRQ